MIGVYEVRTKAPSSAAAFDRRYRRRTLRGLGDDADEYEYEYEDEGDLSPEAPENITPPVATSPGTAAPGTAKDTGSIFSSIASGLQTVLSSPLTKQATSTAAQYLQTQQTPTATVAPARTAVRTVAAPAKTNYLPWILGGVAVVGLVGFLIYRSKRSASAKPA